MQRRLILTLIALLVLIPNASQAFKIAGGLGLGSTKMTNEATDSEGPFTQIFSIEKLDSSKVAYGIEHLRSMTSGLVTSASFIGVFTRVYLTAAPTKAFAIDRLDMGYSLVKDWAIFLAIGAGYAQSSRLPNDVGLSSNGAGIYLSPRAGVDYQLNRNLGLRSELLFATTVMGKGSVTQMALTGSVYWIF